MAFQLVLNGPGQDKELDLQTKFNYNANQSIDSISISGNTLTLGRYGGGSISAQLPIAPNRIISGMVSTTVGFTLNTTAGTYQINNSSYVAGAFAGTIPAAHATLNRIDILVANSLGYLYKTGTASVNPAAPVLLANEVLVTQINIPAGGVPNQGNGFYTLPIGTVDGAVLTWDVPTDKWIETPNNRVTSATSFLEVTSSANIQVGTLPIGSYLNLNTNSAKLGVQFAATHFAEMNIISGGIEITANGTGSQAVTFDVEQGIRINPNIPVSLVDKLYNSGGDLWWNTDKLNNVENGTVVTSMLNWSLGKWEENTYHQLIGASASLGDVVRGSSGSVTRAFSAMCESINFDGSGVSSDVGHCAMICAKQSDQTATGVSNASIDFCLTSASLNCDIKVIHNQGTVKQSAIIASQDSNITSPAVNGTTTNSLVTGGGVGTLTRSNSVSR